MCRRGFLSLQLAARSEVAELVGHQANKQESCVSVEQLNVERSRTRYNLFTESLEVPDPSRGSVVTERAKPSVRILNVYVEHCQKQLYRFVTFADVICGMR
jgi:hypothetical protein